MKLGLLTKMSLYILIPSLLGLGLVAGVSHQMSENALRLQTRQDIAAILKGQEVGLNAVFQSMKEALAQMAENRRLRLYLEAYSKNSTIDHNDELFLHAIDALKNFTAVNSNIATCGLIAPDGKVIARSYTANGQPEAGQSRTEQAFRGSTAARAAEKVRHAVDSGMDSLQ